MTVIVTGGNGTLGRALAAVLPEALRPNRDELELTDEGSVRAYFRRHPPAAIVHAAALTDIETCERDRELAWRVNVEGTRSVFRAARKAAPESYFLYVSTAGVFRGDTGNYNEDASPNPVNYYGVTKLNGEKVVREEEHSSVVRTNFVRRGKWPHPVAFVDRFGTFLYDTGAAKGIRDVLAARATGVIHVCGILRLSLFELARRTDSEIKPIMMAEYKGPPLARDMSLVTRRWRTYDLED